MAEAPITTGSTTESWLREALDRLRLEVVLFGRTFAAFCMHPGRSAGQWQAGERDFMNPLGFAAAAAGVYWAATNVLAVLWPIPGSELTGTPAQQLGSAVTPYVHYGLLGTAMHLGLRGLGSGRRLLGSIGTAFFTGGSLGTVAALLLRTAVHGIGHVHGTSAFEVRSGDLLPLLLFLAAGTSYVLVCVVMLRGMMALHQVPGWKAVLAGAFALFVTALLFGSVLPEGEYGWHPYLRVDLDRGWALSFGFRG
jgi:hypothetical protein